MTRRMPRPAAVALTYLSEYAGERSRLGDRSAADRFEGSWNRKPLSEKNSDRDPHNGSPRSRKPYKGFRLRVLADVPSCEDDELLDS